MKTKGLTYNVVLIMALYVLSAGGAWAVPSSDTIIGDNFTPIGSDTNTTTTGTADVFIGGAAGQSNISGSDNTFIGREAGLANTSGSSNTYLGRQAGMSNTSGKENTFIGFASGSANLDGSGNVFLGNLAGSSETGSNKLYIDNCFFTVPFAGCILPLIYGEFDNRIVRIDGTLTMVTVATPSDVRYKKEIHPLESSLEKVVKLRGVTYEWDKDKVNGAGYKNGRQIGLIAQEVEKVIPELVQTDKSGYKTLSYDKLGPLLIEAMKEQQGMISHLQQINNEKESRIEKLEKALEAMEKHLAAIESPAKTIASK